MSASNLDRSVRKGRWIVVAGVLVILVTVVYTIWTVFFDDAAIAVVSVAPLIGGIFLLFNGLQLSRVGEVNSQPNWLVTVKPSSNAIICRIAATSSGRYETWVVDGTRLIDKSGTEHDLTQLRGATVLEQHNGITGWSSSHKLKFPDTTATIRVADDRNGPNWKAYDMLLNRIRQVMVQHNPDAQFQKRFLHFLGGGWSLVLSIVGILFLLFAIGLVVLGYGPI